MSKRIIHIMQEFKKTNGEFDLKIFSNFLGINERTLRYDIDFINSEFELLGMKQIITINKGKVRCNLKNLENYLAKSTLFQKKLLKEYKKEFLLIHIVFKGKINITKLCDDMDISRSTIKSALNEIKTILETYQLTLTPDKKIGLKLNGEESNLRRFQLKLLNQYFKKSTSFESEYISIRIKNYIGQINEIEIKKFINKVLDSLNRVISDEAYEILINYILILIFRVKNNFMLIECPNKNFFYESDEYNTIKKYVNILEKYYSINLNFYELLELTNYFMGSHLYSNETSSMMNWIEVEILTKNLIKEFSKRSKYNLEDDRTLLEGLSNHIKPTIYRIKNKIELENKITVEFKTHYPNILENTTKSIWILEEFIGEKIPIDEIAFIGMYFKSAIDNNKEITKEKKVLIVCAMGYGTSKFISQQIKNIYSVDIVNIVPENFLSKYSNLNDIDFIISTSMKGDKYKGIPIIKISPILDNNDYVLLEKYGIKKHTNKISLSQLVEKIKLNANIENYQNLLDDLRKIGGSIFLDDIKNASINISDLLFYETVDIETKKLNWQEAIYKTGKLLEDNKFIKKSYAKKMIDSILKNGSYMITNEGLAFPHAKNTGDVLKTGMALLVLKEKVIFPENREVRVILAFTSIDDKEHLEPLTQFMNLIKKYDFMNFLEQIDNKKKIIEKINKFNFLSKIGRG